MVIDELIVTLGLDPKNFDTGAKQAAKAIVDAQNQIGQSTKNAEAGAKKMFEAYSAVQNRLLGIFALFVGGRGAKEFVSWQVETTANMGRQAKAIGSTVGELSRFRGAVEAAGGDAEAAGQSVNGLVQEFQKFSLTGESGMVPWLRALGVEVADAKGEMRPFLDIMRDLADKFSKMTPARAHAFGAQLGLDVGTINFLIKGRAAVTGLLEEQRKLAEVTERDVEVAQKAQTEWRKMEQSATKLGRTLITALAPSVTAATDALNTGIQSLSDTPEERAKRLAEMEKKQGGTSHEVLRKKFGEPSQDTKTFFENLFGLKPGTLDNKPEVGGATNGTSSTLPPEARALLEAIASGESNGRYDVMYGGGKFSDFRQHPNQPHLITSGPNAGRTSTAAGKYMFIKSTWDEAQSGLGLKDFGAENQDQAAWYIAQRDYKKRTGRDLLEDLKANDPTKRAFITGALSKTWTSLPGGIEQGQNASRFADAITFAKSNTTATANNGTTNDIKIGTITVETKATDAPGIARAIGPAIHQRLAVQANTGPL